MNLKLFCRHFRIMKKRNATNGGNMREDKYGNIYDDDEFFENEEIEPSEDDIYESDLRRTEEYWKRRN